MWWSSLPNLVLATSDSEGQQALSTSLVCRYDRHVPITVGLTRCYNGSQHVNRQPWSYIHKPTLNLDCKGTFVISRLPETYATVGDTFCSVTIVTQRVWWHWLFVTVITDLSALLFLLIYSFVPCTCLDSVPISLVPTWWEGGLLTARRFVHLTEMFLLCLDKSQNNLHVIILHSVLFTCKVVVMVMTACQSLSHVTGSIWLSV